MWIWHAWLCAILEAMSPLLNHSFFRFTATFMLILMVGFVLAFFVGYLDKERDRRSEVAGQAESLR